MDRDFYGMQPRGRSGHDLLRLWEWAAESGRMNGHTANQYRTACARILDAAGAGANVDVTKLDSALQRIEITLPSGGTAEIRLPDGATTTDVIFLARVLPNYAGDGA